MKSNDFVLFFPMSAGLCKAIRALALVPYAAQAA